MSRYLLLQIEDLFQLPHSLVAAPNFPPVELPAKSDMSAILRTPAGVERLCTVALQLNHFNIAGSTDVQQRWRLVPVISDLTKEDIPIGSKLIIDDQEIARALNLQPFEHHGIE